MRLLRIILCFLLPAAPVAAVSQGSIIQVSRRLAMDTQAPQPPKEYYVNVGSRDGLSIGDTLEVSRQVPVVDALAGGNWHLMRVVLGKLRLVYVGETVSLGRVQEMKDASELPPMQYFTFMVGDEVERKRDLPNFVPPN